MPLDTLKEILIGVVILAVLLVIAGQVLISVGGLNLGGQLDAKKVEITGGKFEYSSGILKVTDIAISYTGKKPVILYPIFKIENFFQNKMTIINSNEKNSDKKYSRVDVITLTEDNTEPKNFMVIFQGVNPPEITQGTLTIFFYRAKCNIQSIKQLQNCARNFISSDSVQFKQLKEQLIKNR
jgi:hypothetical protein